MKIALFGGSFNPIHIGHIKLAEYTIEKLGLDKLIFIPAFKSLEKIDFFYEAPEMRCNLIKQVIPKLSEISTFEIDLGYPVPSFITVRHFANIYSKNELYFLIGEDCLSTLDTWEGIEEILQLCTVVVWKRYKDNTLPLTKVHKQLYYLDNPIYEFSSSAFRLQKDNYQDLVDSKVFEYIKEHKLYCFREEGKSIDQ